MRRDEADAREFHLVIDEPSASARVAIIMFGLIAILFAMSFIDDYRAGEVSFGWLEFGYIAILAYYAWRVAIHTGGGVIPWRRPRYVALTEGEVAWRLGRYFRTETRLPRKSITQIAVTSDRVEFLLNDGRFAAIGLAEVAYPVRRTIRDRFAALQ